MNNEDKDLKQQELDESTSKTAHTLGKGAATYFGGELGNKAYDLASQTKVGQDIEKAAGRALQSNPFDRATSQALNKSGALDAIDKGMDALGDDPSKALDGLDNNDIGNSLPNTNNNLGFDANFNNEESKSIFGNTNPLSNNTNNKNTETENESYFANPLSGLIKKHKFKLLGIGALIIGIIVIAITIYGAIYSISDNVKNYFSGFFENVVAIFDYEKKSDEEEYYKELKRVQNEIHSSHNLCIDVNLITTALTVDVYPDSMIDDLNKNDTVNTDYKKMKRYVEILANMQLKTKTYKNKSVNGSNCTTGTTPEEELIIDGNYNSSNANLVSTHDLNWDSPAGAIFNFFVKQADEEKNYEYYYYRPTMTQTINPTTNQPVLKCNDTLPDDEIILDVDDNQNKQGSVFYWNLINSFIGDYYDDYLPKVTDADNQEQVSKRSDAIKKIADDIYSLYWFIGPSHNCGMTQQSICRNDDGIDYNNNSSSSDFFDKIASIAINEMTRIGLNASITMAQAALESSYGKSGLSKNYSNYYGMTSGCISQEYPPSEYKGTVLRKGESFNNCTGNDYWDGTVVAACNSEGKDCQWYRVYDSFENSTKDHSRLLTNPSGRYANCNSSKNSNDQITCIKNAGYATDPNYVSKVMNLIQNNGLSQYDIGNWNGEINNNESNNVYQSNMCYYGNSGDWSTWKQGDSRWGSLIIGDKTIKRIGCLMTSVAIQIARSGVYTTLGSNFDPGTFMQEHKKNGGFTYCGSGTSKNCFVWDVTDVAPNFKYKGTISYTSKSNFINQLIDYQNQGYYIIINIHHPGEHHVALDHVEGNKVYIFDPGNFGNELFSTNWHGPLTVNSFSLYKVE